MSDLVTPTEGGAAALSVGTFVQKFALAKYGMRIPVPDFDGTWDAVVVSADATSSTLTFTMPAWDGAPSGVPGAMPNGEAVFGPAPYPQQSEAPPAGTACLVTFVGGVISQPRVLCFYGWTPEGGGSDDDTL